MDEEIRETVESILGKGVKVVDCEKKSCIKEEEVLLINGRRIELEGEDGVAIKEALLRGQIPNCQSLNDVLLKVGILNAPVKLETSLTVKSNVLTREQVVVAKAGHVVDERCRETKEDNLYTSNTSEIWEPVAVFSAAAANSGADTVDNKIHPKSNHDWRDDDDRWSEIDKRCCRGSALLDNKAAIIDYEEDSESSGDWSGWSSVGKTKPAKFRETKISSCWSCNGSEASDQITDLTYSSRLADQHQLQSAMHMMQFNRPERMQSPCFCRSLSCGLIYRDNKLYSGTLQLLVEHLLPESNVPDRTFVFSFLLTSRLFVHPTHLLTDICKLVELRFGSCAGSSTTATVMPSASTKVSQTNQVNGLEGAASCLWQLVSQWTKSFPSDFQRKSAMRRLEWLSRQCVALEPHSLARVSTAMRNLLNTFTANQRYRDAAAALRPHFSNLQQPDARQAPRLPSSSIATILDLCPDPKRLAQHLCHMELEKLSFIGAEEFIERLARIKDKTKYVNGEKHQSNGENDEEEDGEDAHVNKYSNLELYVQWFNRLSSFVATEICKQTKRKTRVKVVEYWVEVAKESFNLGNFNSLMSIIAGLNESAVVRLKKTWAKVQSAKFSILEHQMNPTSNFSSYRSTLKAAMWRSTSSTHSCNLANSAASGFSNNCSHVLDDDVLAQVGDSTLTRSIVIPFFSLFIKDIYFLYESSPDKLSNGEINFEKMNCLANQINEFNGWKKHQCTFEKDIRISAFIQDGVLFSESELMLASFDCEQPENAAEKEKFRNLKT